MQAAVVVLNNRGWVGYLVAHEANPKLYCHFHYQENMDGELLISNARTLVWYGVFRMFRALFFKRWNCST